MYVPVSAPRPMASAPGGARSCGSGAMTEAPKGVIIIVAVGGEEEEEVVAAASIPTYSRPQCPVADIMKAASAEAVAEEKDRERERKRRTKSRELTENERRSKTD